MAALAARLSPAEARAEFQTFREWTYLDAAARAPMADRVSRELQTYLDVCRSEGAHKAAWLDRVETIRERFAGFIGASPTEVAFMKNTSDGLNTLAHGLDLRAGDNVIVCPEIEHANNVYLWLHLQAQGIEVRLVPPDGGTLSVDRVAASVDDRTRIVSLSSVSFVTGARADLASLAGFCRPRNIFLLVDAVQGLGIVRMNVRELGIDGLAAATQKGLLGMYGQGVLYCRREWLDRIEPPYMSGTGVELGGHESELGDLAHPRVRKSAKKLELGNPNFAGLFALDAALSLLEDIGAAAIEMHVLALAQRLMARLDRLGLPVVTPREPERHAGIVVFEHPNLAGVATMLEAHHVKLSVRRGRIRAGMHVFNNEADVDRLVHLLGAA